MTLSWFILMILFASIHILKALNFSNKDAEINPDNLEIQRRMKRQAKTFPSDSTATQSNKAISSDKCTLLSTINYDDLPNFRFYKTNLFENMTFTSTVSPGEVFRAFLDIDMKKYTTHHLAVRFSTLRNESKVFDISNVNLVSKAHKINQDIAAMDLGNVTCRGDGSLNCSLIRVEIVARLWSNSTKKSGDTLFLSAMIDINNSTYIHVIHLPINISNEVLQEKENYPQDNFNSYLSLNATHVRIGDILNATLMLKIPRESIGECYFDFQSPNMSSTNSEIFHLISISIVNSGRNLALIHNEPFTTKFFSSRNNTQHDKGFISPSFCFNTGVTHRTDVLKTGDDNITISFIFRVTDNQETQNGTNFTVSVGVQFGSYIIIENSDVKILRDGSEKPSFNCSTEILNLKEAGYQSNESIHLSTQCRLTEKATAEPQNVSFKYYLPPYVSYVEKSLNPESYTKGKLIPVSSKSILQVKMSGPLLFGDFVNFTFKIQVQANNKIHSNAITPWEVAYTIHNMSGNPLARLQLKEANFLKFTVLGFTTQSPTCLDSLGMNDSNVIKDCAIKAFMSPFAGHEAIQARPKGKGWIPHVRDKDYNALRYISILFGTMKDINQIEVYPMINQSRVLMIDILRTYDGRTFVLAVSALTLKYNETTNTASTLIHGQLRARGVRIVITMTTNDSDTTPFRFELFGCTSVNISLLSQDFDPCSRQGFDEVTEDEIPKEHYHRGYLYHHNLNTLYYCDTVVTDKESLKWESRCFRTKDAERFEVLGRDVSSIVGVATHDNTLFGVSTNRRNYVTSRDNGTTWSLITPSAWQVAKFSLSSNNLLTAVDLPWIVNSTFNAKNTGLNCSRVQKDWRFCFDGIYVKQQHMIKWNSCCSIPIDGKNSF